MKLHNHVRIAASRLHTCLTKLSNN